ncbi:hypothetical protein LOTGIDRAFT_178302 [Lottia gigantea]|uniref:Cationic amino acid transporter C-terminal domain-containing protein n=1 Tax=Lottia gigantea TaxID=225164 RepID=V4APW0_LOTGI|nr:hypothetical protein LOTGIDRAFT_178302 [Lottia gigantea]ESO95676.1 hypothetical protein LOTGIDRAFT_178302 [Lottia gigantea]
MGRLGRFVAQITRKKTITADFHETSLRKCLTTFDITFLGIGHMVGAGIYVISGAVVRLKAGPSAILSFLFAGVAAFLSALCYAEFGARVPKAGSAYSYTYITVGEIWGFVVGWNILLEHVIGAASVARAWSASMDSLVHGAIKNGTITAFGTMGSPNGWVSEYPDLLAFLFALVAFIIVATGAKFSVRFNTVFTMFNGAVILFIVCAGLYFADFSNWTNENRGGFFPFGFGGTLTGAASCFFAYIGFEGIAIASEESEKPEKAIPLATGISLLVVTLIYMFATTTLTLMEPYYHVDTSAAFPFAFAYNGAYWAKYIVAGGTLLGLTTSMLGTAFSLPRAVYAMANDGLLFKFFARVHPSTQTPLYSIAVFGVLACIMALLFEIDTLVEFMSIGTLMAYTIVAVCIIILRHLPVSKCQFELHPEEVVELETEMKSENTSIIKKSKSHDDFGHLKQNVKNLPILRNLEPGDAVIFSVMAMLISMMLFIATLIYGWSLVEQGTWWIIILIPYVPLLPALSMFLNIALMFSLSFLTWIRLFVWIGVGLLLYFCYGMHFSLENRSASGYGQIVEYPKEPETSVVESLNEDIREQQPARKDQGLF